MKTGVDITLVKRFKKNLNNEKFLNKVFTKTEIDHILQHKTTKGMLERMAGKFCVKEAVGKALGTGISQGVRFTDIEVNINNDNRPYVVLYGRAKDIFEQSFKEIDVSISHDGGMAVAFCVLN